MSKKRKLPNSPPPDFRAQCTTMEQCLPVAEYRVQLARLHNEMLDENERLKLLLTLLLHYEWTPSGLVPEDIRAHEMYGCGNISVLLKAARDAVGIEKTW